MAMSAVPERDPVKASGWLGLLALLVPLVVPLALTPLPLTADGRNHILRTVLLTHSLTAGEWFPRYSPELAYGYGAPLFHYYAPLTYYLTALVSGVGLGPSFGFQVVMGASLVLGSVGAALWAGSWFGPWARWVAGVAWAAWPYLLYDVYTRGAGPEVLGLAWLPWIGWALSEAIQHGTGRSRVALAVSVAGLLFSHNLTALLGAGLLAIVALVDIALAATGSGREGLAKRLAWVGGAGLIGAALSAFFWLPAVLETGAVKMSAATDLAGFDFRDNFLNLSSLLTGAFTFDPRRVLPPVPISLGWGGLLLIGLGLAAAIGLGRDREGRLMRSRIALCLVLATGCMLMTLAVSRPIWEVLPLAQLIQFPSRWLGPAGLLVALLGGAGAAWLGRRWPRRAGALSWALAGGVVVLSWPWTFSKPDPTLQAAPRMQALYAAEVDLDTLGLTSTGEFLPAGSTVPAPDAAWAEAAYAGRVERVDRTSPVDGVSIETLRQDRLMALVSVTSAEPVTLTFRWLYWPGWEATLDGAPWAVQAGSGEGFVQVNVPAGRHRVEVRLGQTPLRQAAEGLSLLGWVIGVGLLIGVRRHARANVQPSAVTPRTALAVAVSIGLALTLLRLALELVPNPLRATRLEGETVSGVQTPRQVRFGDGFTLLGIDAPAAVAADLPLIATVYWGALAPVGQDLSYSLQVWDQENVLLSQADVMNPGGFPVRRWVSGDYTADTLTLQLDPTVPPGPVRLMVTVYTTDPPRTTIPGRHEAGPLESHIEVGQVQVTRSRAPVAPDAVPNITWLTLEAGPLAAVAASDWPDAITAGDALRLRMYWSARAVPEAEPPHIVLRDAEGRDHDLGPARLETANFARTDWRPGDVWQIQTPVVVPPTIAPGPGEWRLHAGQQDLVLGAATVTVPERVYALPPDLLGAPIVFDQIADLVGYRLSGQAAPGCTLVINLVWRATAVTPRALTVFVQVLGADGLPAAQSDRVPAQGQRPTTGWLPPEIIVDRHEIVLPDPLPSGTYPLSVGLYDPLTGARVPVLSPNAGPSGDVAILQMLVVEEGDGCEQGHGGSAEGEPERSAERVGLVAEERS